MTTKPRVLFVSHSAIVPGYRCLAARIAERGRLDVSLVAPRNWIEANSQQSYIEAPDMDDSIRIMVERTLCWGFRNRTARNVTHIYPGTLKILEQVNPQILYLVEEPYSLVTSSWIWACSLLGISPAIVVFSGQSVYKSYPFPFNFLEKHVISRAHMFLPVNNDVAAVLRKKGANRTRVVPLGYDEKMFLPPEKQGWDFSVSNPTASDRPFTIGFLGTLSRQKGIPELLKAFEILTRNSEGEGSPEFRLIVIGEGPLRGTVQEAALDNPALDFRGFIPHSQVPQALKNMDLLVVPSVDMENVREQLGRVIIEAMACGVPVIGSDSGEIGRVIGNQAMIFPQGDACALASSIQRMARDRELYRLEKSRVVDWAEKFSWSSIAAAVENHLLDALALAGGGSSFGESEDNG